MLRCEPLSNLASARLPPQIPAVELEQVERAKHGGCFAAVTADQVKDGKAVLVANDRLAVDQARGNRQLADRLAIKGKRDEKSFPARVISLTPALSRRDRMRNPSCLISCSHPDPEGGAFAGDGKHGSIIPSPWRVRSRNDIGIQYERHSEESSPGKEKPRPVFWGIAGPGLGLVGAGSGARQRNNGDSVSERLSGPGRHGAGGSGIDRGLAQPFAARLN